MTVTVQKLQGGLGSGSLPATNFSDTFVRADAPPFLGPQWFTMENQNNLVDGGSVDLCTNITANKAIFGSGTVTSYGNMSVQFTPAAVYVPAIVTKVQTQGRKMFSQFQITSHTANGLNFGPMVLGVVNAFGYTLDLSGAGLKAQLLRGLGINVPVQTLLATNLFTWADGDVVRIEGAFTAGACTLEFFQNGVSKGTFVDNSVGRIAAPQIYGISMANVGANNSIAVNNFSGGIV